MFGWGRKATFVSPYDADECVDRLNGELDSIWDETFRFFPTTSFIGRASFRRISIRKQRGFFRSFYPVHFIGQVRSDVSGSRIVGRFRIALPLFLFAATWFAVLISIMIGDVVTAIKTGDPSLAFTAFMILIVGLLVFAGQRFKGLDDEARICQMLTETVDAHRVD
jgi:hypothetical protein